MKYFRLLALFWLGPVLAQSAPPNLLFILSDNQPASIMGTYGNPDVRTPNIDRLASEGIRFDHAFSVNGMCSPTRATLMTGLMPSQHGLHNWLDDEMMSEWPREWSAIAEFRTLPLTLRNRGYQTALIGKWHLGQPWKASIGYEHWVTFTDGHTVDFWDNTVIENDETYPVKDQHIVDFFTDKAVEYIENYDGSKPFYLQLNYDGPYLNPPTNMGPARNRHYESYVGQKFDSFPRVALNKNVLGQLLADDTNAFMQYALTMAVSMHNDPATMANVASQNTIVDDGVGRVMAALEEAGLDENTLVIYSSDQGNFYGHHGLWQHQTATTPTSLYEVALNVPLIVRHTGMINPGRTNDSLIGQYDMPGTILEYLGITDVEFEGSPGRSFVSQIKGTGGSWEDIVFFEQEESRGVRTPEFAYWKRLETTGGDVLYDMKADPGQEVNLIDDEGMARVVRELDDLLTGFFDTYSDEQYDLWRGGFAKGSVIRPEMFQRIYGADWAPRTPMLEPFEE
jgi:arylsulfatase A-like enzyme